jgi:hypothetical protein
VQDEVKKPWTALTPSEMGEVFAGATFPWWIAGGYAIEQAVGRAFRTHADIDVLVLRQDATEVRAFLKAWDCWMADPPGTLRPWPLLEALPERAHDVWCRKTSAGDWRFQLMFDESGGEIWHSRRDARIIRPIAELETRDAAGLPYLRPEIQLCYKAKALRPKDESDFRAVLPILNREQRRWLAEAIERTHGDNHPWLAFLGRS